MLEAKVYITLKKTVADPQGLTIKHALDTLGFDQVTEARIGKLVTLSLNIDDREEAKSKIAQMCQKLLVNPVIEEYSFEIE